MDKKANNQASAHQGFSIKTIILPLFTVIIGMFMVVMDNTVMNVALPEMVNSFKSDLSTMQWTITGYSLALAAVIPLAGWLTDRFGAKRIFLITISLFTIGSILCALAVSPVQLIVFRIIQGLGGGMVAPIGMTVAFRLAPSNKVGSVLSVMGIPMMLAPAVGPILSGWLLEMTSWQWIFLINLPIGVLALLIGLKFLPKFDRSAVFELDTKGMILAPIAFALLAFAVNQAGTVGWGAVSTLIAMAVGGMALILFIVTELRRKQPLLELRVFRSFSFSLGIVLFWVMSLVLYGSFLLFAYYLQSIKGYDPFFTGLTLLPEALATCVFMPFGGKLYDKFGVRPVALTGLSIITVALFLFSNVSMDTSPGYIMVILAMMGAGMGLSMMPINSHVLQAAPENLASRVNSLTNASQQVMVSFAVAGLTGFLASRVRHFTPIAKDNPMVPAFEDTFRLVAVIALIGVFLSVTLRRPKSNAKEVEQTEETSPLR